MQLLATHGVTAWTPVKLAGANCPKLVHNAPPTDATAFTTGCHCCTRSVPLMPVAATHLDLRLSGGSLLSSLSSGLLALNLGLNLLGVGSNLLGGGLTGRGGAGGGGESCVKHRVSRAGVGVHVRPGQPLETHV